jgi:KDO2-lipid IV(A) lauroyltransferase
VVYWLFRLGARLACLAPLRLSYAIATFAGTIGYYGWPGGRRRAQQNLLRACSGNARAARGAARRSFQNYARYLVDFLRLIGQDEADIRRRVQFDAWESLHAERTGNGIVLVTMHFGNWDLGAARLALEGLPVAAIADTFSDERVNRMVIRSREHLGMRIIPVDRMGPGILRALRNNDIVAVLVDVPQQHGVRVQFFGETIAVPDGPARIALRAGSSVVAAALTRVTPWSDDLEGSIAPIEFVPSGDQDLDVQRLTQAVFAQLEQFVRRDPSQWYIFRHLWVSDFEPAPISA